MRVDEGEFYSINKFKLQGNLQININQLQLNQFQSLLIDLLHFL